jgi:hypothetical protein
MSREDDFPWWHEGASWADYRDWMISSFSDADSPGWIVDQSDSQQVTLVVVLPSGHKQQMLVRDLPVGNEDEWLEIACIVCEEHELDARAALIKNECQVVGHLALESERGRIWFRHTLQVEYLTPEQLAGTLALMANVGDWTEQQLTGEDRW